MAGQPVIRFERGDLRLTVLDGGSLWLDGGAMFGVVPRALWQRLRQPDERNRIKLAMNLLLIEDGSRRILVDTGSGTDWDEKSRKIYNMDARDAGRILEPAGLDPADIDLVVNTHLHFDHASGNVRMEGETAVPAFPNAEYLVQRAEVETAQLDFDRVRAAYPRINHEPLLEAGRMKLLDGNTRLHGYLDLEVARGHTPGMQIVRVTTGKETVAFMADLVPTASHLPNAYVMGFDLEPMETMASKANVLPRAMDEGWTVVFEHDAELPVARLDVHEGRPRATPVEAAPIEETR